MPDELELSPEDLDTLIEACEEAAGNVEGLRSPEFAKAHARFAAMSEKLTAFRESSEMSKEDIIDLLVERGVIKDDSGCPYRAMELGPREDNSLEGKVERLEEEVRELRRLLELVAHQASGMSWAGGRLVGAVDDDSGLTKQAEQRRWRDLSAQGSSDAAQ